MSLNHELSDLFARMADIMDIRGENTFKVLAFRKVSRIVRDLPADLRQHVEDGTVDQIEGIGKSSQRVIEEYVKTGRSTDHDELTASVPAGLLPLLQLEGLGPKTIALLWKERNITSDDELKKAIDDGALAGIKGIGEKKIIAMKRALELAAQSAGRKGIGEVLPVAELLVDELRRVPGVIRAEVAGSLRRRRETIGDVDLLCCVNVANEGPAITEAFTKLPIVARVLGQGPTKASIVTAGGLQVDLRVLTEEHFGSALLYFTGSKDHNVVIRSLAQKKGLTLNEWGLYKIDEYEKAGKKTSEAPPIKPVASRTEKEIYAKLGMAYVEPELREDRGEVDAAIAGKLPKLITRAALRGDLHTHTTASDGVNSIEEMAEAAKALGFEYLAITDHSKSQVIANGLDEKRLLAHVEQIRKASAKIKGITLLAGAEVDILSDGRLDYDDDVLKELDIVVASPHFALKQDQQKATERLVRAIENRYVNIIGHPTGRLIGGREGLPLDFPAIYRAAAASGTALEINAGYPRLDLDEVRSRAAIDAGVMLSINTDAHATAGFAGIEWGLGVARRAWVEPKHVINCMKLADLRTFLAKKRSDSPIPSGLINPLDADQLLDLFRHPPELHAPAVVLGAPNSVPDTHGVYGWYFREGSLPIPAEDCVRVGAWLLMYVGIAGKRDGGKQTLRGRIIERHLNGPAHMSTLRLALGSLLWRSLGLRPSLAGKGSITFVPESQLSRWIFENARVTWFTRERPVEIEARIISSISLPLNTTGNRSHPFSSTLRTARSTARKEARHLE